MRLYLHKLSFLQKLDGKQWPAARDAPKVLRHQTTMDSWYERSLVTRTSEDILAAIDNRGIQIFEPTGACGWLPFVPGVELDGHP